MSSSNTLLWPEMRLLERNWLSSNNIVFTGQHSAVVDTGYCSQAQDTVQLVQQALSGQALGSIINTHLHSDHCGGNAALQAAYPAAHTWIAPGQAEHVRNWNPEALSYTPTGQHCPQFRADGVLQPGSSIMLGERLWEVHAAPGHDPHSIILFEPERRILISADALWENGFGIIFPELEGQAAFDEAAATLDVIEQLQPALVLPGHGAMFSDLQAALNNARRRLDSFQHHPLRHANYAAKVLLKYKFLEWQQTTQAQATAWCAATPLMQLMRQRYFADQDNAQWVQSLLEALRSSQALHQSGDFWVDGAA